MSRCVILSGMALMLCLVSGVEARVWYVHPDSSIKKIQAGLDSCCTGDTVRVGPGTYVENLIWPNTQGIDLVSVKGPDSTTIDGSNPSNPDSGSVVFIKTQTQQDTGTVINGFTITNGTGTIRVNGTYGGGIYCEYASVSIISNVITGNAATWGGGGIECYFSPSSYIANNVISNNTADTAGGGILVYNVSNPTIRGNRISRNTSAWGGGMYIVGWSNPSLSRNYITGNHASSYGGGVGITWSSAPTMQDDSVVGNRSDRGGAGIHCGNSSRPTIIGCVVKHDTAGILDFGGGVRIHVDASPTIKHTTVADNVGAGVSCYSAGGTFDSCTISGNSYHGVYCYTNGNPTLHWCHITNNAYNAVCNLDPAVTINAENNWWGDSTGPCHSSNPGGRGDTVSDYVDFIPWLRWPVSVEEQDADARFSIHDARLRIFPNPFRNKCDIRFTMHDSRYRNEKACLSIYDATGRLVKSFPLATGYSLLSTSIVWDGRDDRGSKLPAGVYIVRYTAGEHQETGKIVMVQ